ncbi:MAG: glutaredoxin [Myxococcales bacterium]|nr:glutaredoxin [Myxococcales bacterium]HRC57665.1 glutaredoxin [Kofleriaceae bacterium]
MPSSITKRATERLFSALNRADELGGELRDYVQDKVLVDPRYVSARKKVAQLLGRSYESKEEATGRAQVRAATVAAVAATAPAPAAMARSNERTLGNPEVKAQIYGKKSCPWSGRAISLLERHKVDFDFVDLEEPEHEALIVRLASETRQHTVPYVYLRGHFIGGFNALSEVERLGQLEVALMSAKERQQAPAHQQQVQIVPRPNTDDVAPGEVARDDEQG